MPISGFDQSLGQGPVSAEIGSPETVRLIAGRLAEVRQRIDSARARGGRGQPVRVVAVTKTHGPDTVRAAFQAGIEDVGENRVQEATAKMVEVEAEVRWHLVGHLQRNKVAQAARFHMVHSMDSLRLAEALDREGEKRGRPLEVLVQINASAEATKGGFDPSGIRAAADRLAAMGGLRVRGVMTIAAIDASDSVLRSTFTRAREARDALAAAGLPATELSMGMSQDYEIAVEEGATLVRLGTILFGERGGSGQ